MTRNILHSDMNNFYASVECKRCAARKVGGTGIRYTVSISGQETYLFEDEGKWFVEAKQ